MSNNTVNDINMKNKDKHTSQEEKKAENTHQENEVKEQEVAAEEQDTDQEVPANEVEQLKAELNEQKEKYIRLYSDFENLRRRTAKEKLELIKTANEDVLKDLLPVLDDFERALGAIEGQENIEALKEGVDLVYNKFKKTLEHKGLQLMEIEKGDDFDADFHEAITQIPVQEDKMKGKIVDVIEKGYMLGDKVIRFAKVVTGA